MTFNPLDESDPAFHERLRERAYHLWEADGRPHGRDREYWERARELLGLELSAQSRDSDSQAVDTMAEDTSPADDTKEVKKARKRTTKPKAAKK